MNFLKSAFNILGSMAFFVLLIVVFNVYLYFMEGSPTIPSLSRLWWAGYYGDKSAADADKVWCLVRFERGNDRKYGMKLMSSPVSTSDFRVDQAPMTKTLLNMK